MRTFASVAVLLIAVLQPPVNAHAQKCPNCDSIPMPMYPKEQAFKLEVDSTFAVRCFGTTTTNEYLHVRRGAFVGWTLAPKAGVASVVVEFGSTTPFEAGAHTFLVYKGQWTWARIRPDLKVDKDAGCDGSNTTIYMYTLGLIQSGPGIIVCPPDRPDCQ
jgi:hypothetical protein